MKNIEIIKTFLISGLLGLVIVQSCQKQELTNDLKIKSEIVEAKTSELKTIENKNGELLQEKRIAEVDKKNLESYYKELVNDLKETHNIKVKELESYIRTELNAVGEGVVEIRDTTIVIRDTVQVAKAFGVYDGYLNFSGLIKDGDIRYEYTYSDSLSFATFWKKTGPIWNRSHELTASIYSSNTNSDFSNYESVKMSTYTEKKYSLGLGVSVDIKGRIMPSISIHRSIIKL